MPSRYATVATAKLQEPITERSFMLFEPNEKWSGGDELQIENSLVQPDSEGEV